MPASIAFAITDDPIDDALARSEFCETRRHQRFHIGMHPAVVPSQRRREGPHAPNLVRMDVTQQCNSARR